MYSKKPSIVYGFHGLDQDIATKILNQKLEFKASENIYDWLGNGIYFWESSPERALDFASTAEDRGLKPNKTPSVLGAVIDLGNCLDLTDQKYLNFVRVAYERLADEANRENRTLPSNRKTNSEDFNFKLRELDCAVIRYAHQIACENNEPFDTVRAVFVEGNDLYPTAGFKAKNHIQIAVLNPDCIKGIFLPRERS